MTPKANYSPADGTADIFNRHGTRLINRLHNKGIQKTFKLICMHQGDFNPF